VLLAGVRVRKEKIAGLTPAVAVPTAATHQTGVEKERSGVIVLI
jgi:hypothetical protein